MRSKNLFSMTLILSTAFFIAACGGKDKNKVNSNTLSSGTSAISVGSNPINTSGMSATTIQAINQLEQRYACQSQNGSSRIYKQFHTTQATGNLTTISAKFTDGYLAGSSDGMVFIGVNYVSRDFIYVQKVINGTQVAGFNVTLSFCQIPYVISADRSLSGLEVRNMTMTTNTSLGYGTVDYATSLVYSIKDSSQQRYFPFGGMFPHCSNIGAINYPDPYLVTYGICTNFARPQ